ncbi:CHAT domain-containing protein [Dichomitus squalens]|uniref:CHAT domain-containing protein n=1 Tax=Dichomitus squalens TaxID=114155 RepID=A0A4Q9M485_9APHY|nr:CHAT domain-containing protein [Dichomitus squalens]
MFALLERATTLRTASAQDRLTATGDWATAARQRQHPTTISAYSHTLALLDLCLTATPTAELQHKLLVELDRRSIACEACAAAIELGDLEVAVELLERGRGLLWARLTRFRHPLDDLKAVNPDLARSFEESSRELEELATSSSEGAVGTAAASSSGPMSTPRFDKQLHTLHTTSERLHKVVEEMRRIPRFANFLDAVPYTDLCKAAATGPTIIVNICEFRSDALIIRHDCPPLLVPLPAATPSALVKLSAALTNHLEEIHSALDEDASSPVEDGFLASFLSWFPWTWISTNTLLNYAAPQQTASASVHDKEIRRLLRTLWDIVVEPIANKLIEVGVQQHSRVWWYPTGVLCRLPLHAAGPYKRSQPGFHELYVSSYTTTLSRALSCVDDDTTAGNDGLRNMLLVSVAGDPSAKHKYLKTAAAEADVIRHFSDSFALFLALCDDAASPQAVLAHLHEYSWAHFTCHGHQNPSLFDSSFELHGEEYLRLINIVRSRLPNAELAFLSACNTATGDFEGAPDEVIHLAAAMQFCGFHQEKTYFSRAPHRSSRALRDPTGAPEHREPSRVARVVPISLRALGSPAEVPRTPSSDDNRPLLPFYSWDLSCTYESSL